MTRQELEAWLASVHTEDRNDVEARFWRKVARGLADQCWPWTGSRSALGYGLFSARGCKSVRAARLVLVLDGRAPGKLHALHTCDNPPCCNPAHLYAGTHQENVDDRTRRKRGVTPTPLVDITGLRFRRWTVLRVAGTGPDGNRRWVGRCDCGAVNENLESRSLRTGKTKQCDRCADADRARSLPRGERHHKAKLTLEKARAIRRAAAGGATISGLARDYGVCRASIQSVVRGSSWREAPA